MPLPPQITDTTNYSNGGEIQLTWAPAGTYYGYCTVADVQYEFPNATLFSKLTMSAIAQEISYAAEEIQEQLALIYQMPYTGTDGGILLRLRQLNAKLATANLLDRYVQDSDEEGSSSAAAVRSWAELVLKDILDGVIQWAPPFGDAVPMSERPTYPLSSGATVAPNPNPTAAQQLNDPLSANPIFTLGRSRWRGGLM